MRIVLLWRHSGDRESALDPEQVGSRLQKLFAPLVSAPFRVKILRDSLSSLVFLDLPVHGWKPAFFQEDDRTWALALDYPIDAASALSVRGKGFPDGRIR